MQVKIGECTLYHGDTMDILPTLEPAHMLCCDPPYKLTSGGGKPQEGQKRMSGCFNIGDYNNDGNLVLCEVDWPDFMPLFHAALHEDAHAYVMANNRNVQAMLNAAEAAGFRFHNLLVWDKITATANRWYMKNLEYVGFFYKGRAKAINNCSAKQLIRCQQKDETNHPTEKPVALMAEYISNSSAPGDIVLDPFMGSGSTGVAAVKTGRKFIGIEKDKRFFDMACERISKSKSILQHDLNLVPVKSVQESFMSELMCEEKNPGK